MMAKTTNSTTNQNTLGQVGLAAAPTDIVPYQQIGEIEIGEFFQASQWGIIPAVSQPSQHFWNWRFEPASVLGQSSVPGPMRLKGIRWANNGYQLEVYRDTTQIGRVNPNSWKTFNTQFQTNSKLTFRVGPKSPGYPFSVIVFYQALWLPNQDTGQVESQAAAADIMSGLQDIEAEGIQEKQSQLAAPSIEPVEPRKTNRFVTWIKNRWR